MGGEVLGCLSGEGSVGQTGGHRRHRSHDPRCLYPIQQIRLPHHGDCMVTMGQHLWPGVRGTCLYSTIR